ncbi:MAG: hypothetical protein GTO41_11790 [Burkholderiales bacterium]|nr:hypothetical protein [Burkholderiales bacterium]
MNNKQAMQERKRAGMRRRLQYVRDCHNLPPLSNRQRALLLDAIMRVEGDAPTDMQLRVLHSLTTRGLFNV